MRAAVLRRGRVETREVPDPVPGPGQVLVRSLATAICASDLHYMDHPEAGADDDSGWSTYDQDVDIVMGHEYCAEVVDYGPGSERPLAAGMRVSSRPVMFAGGGMKIIGQNPETPGGFGEFFLLDEALLKPVRSDLPSETVCVSDAVAVGWSAAKRAQVGPKDVPLVIGCGAIALSVIATLKRLGAGPVLAADFVPSRRALALAMGADVVIDPQEVSPFQVWRDVTADSHGATKNMMAAAGSSACVVIECVGVPGVLESIIRGCERGTRIMSLGGAPEGDHLSTLTAKRKGLNIQFGGGPLPEHWNEAFEAVCSGSLDVSPLLGRTVGLEEVPEALDAAREANGPARIVVVPDARRPGQ